MLYKLCNWLKCDFIYSLLLSVSINPSTTIEVYLLKQYRLTFQRTNMMKKLEIFLVLSLLNPTLETNHTLPKQSEHYLVKWNAWQSLSVLGFVGTLSNTFLIYTFYTQPNMAKSVRPCTGWCMLPHACTGGPTTW